MILLVQNTNEYEIDLRAMIMAFFPVEKLTVIHPKDIGGYSSNSFGDWDFVFTALFDKEETKLRIEEQGHVIFSAYTFGDYTDKKRFRNKLKLAIYKVLKEYTGRSLPWGSLTGMRPTKIATRALESGLDDKDIIDYYMRTYETSEEKAALAVEVARRERRIISGVNPRRDYCLYVGIPFCPSRCVYCSFAAYPIIEYAGKVDAYIDAVRQELQNISLMNHGRRLAAIYVGGGTPTSISAEQLDRLLTEIDYSFDMEGVEEYTVEAGRPDSITPEKLAVMKKHGVTRISINPQSMNADTLRKIGRAHSPEMIVHAMKLARKAGFDNVNMDLIAGLPDEKLGDMAHTLDEVLKLQPESLTVHSLAIKKKAGLNEKYEDYKASINLDVDRMIALAISKAKEAGLMPYYLYRQKNIAGNLENTGFAIPSTECRYNVLIMEERLDTFAAGAGAVTRLLSLDAEGEVTRVDRVENVKNVEEYINRIEEMISRKNEGIAAREI